MQEPAVIAVDRLHRFRWSGGGGGSSKKSSSGPRSEKAERLRELTEKLKGPAPVPPPRRPSRTQASSPPPSGYQSPSQNCPQVKTSFPPPFFFLFIYIIASIYKNLFPNCKDFYRSSGGFFLKIPRSEILDLIFLILLRKHDN